MGHNTTTKTITSAVNTDDPNAVIPIGSHDIGTICTDADINMWARYKPVPWDWPDPAHPMVDKSTGKTIPGWKWWMGKDGMCGLSAPTIYSGQPGYNAQKGLTTLTDTLQKMANAIYAKGPEWKYTPPGANDYKILDSFGGCATAATVPTGYNGRAISPFGYLPGKRYIDQNGSGTGPSSATGGVRYYRIYVPDPEDLGSSIFDPDTNLVITDFQYAGFYKFEDAYLGVMLAWEPYAGAVGWIAATSTVNLSSTATTTITEQTENGPKSYTYPTRRVVDFGGYTGSPSLPGHFKRLFLFLSTVPIVWKSDDPCVPNGTSGAIPLIAVDGPQGL